MEEEREDERGGQRLKKCKRIGNCRKGKREMKKRDTRKDDEKEREKER